MKVLVIADDFTGALDTGVKFSSTGMSTIVLLEKELSSFQIDDTYEVIVIDCETRHFEAETAYRKILTILEKFKNINIDYIFKKTDSALRGNIGKELQAVKDSTNVDTFHFIPAYPQMNRVTINGEQFVDGVGIHKSIYGLDPFEPVKESLVSNIIAEQTNTNVFLAKTDSPYNNIGIGIYDASTKNDLANIAHYISNEKGQKVVAGCGGFAEVLAEQLSNKKQRRNIEFTGERLVAICGSVNPVTVNQVNYTKECGANCIILNGKGYFDKDYFDTDDGGKKLQQWRDSILKFDCSIITTGKISTDLLLKNNENEKDIANTLCKILCSSIRERENIVLLLTGGDILVSFLNYIGCSKLVPLAELVNGVVLSEITFADIKYQVISKSGAFGNETLIIDLVNQIKRNIGNE